MTLILAEGSSFEFVLLAKTRAQANRALRKGWRKHLRQYEMDPTTPQEGPLSLSPQKQGPASLHLPYESLQGG